MEKNNIEIFWEEYLTITRKRPEIGAHKYSSWHFMSDNPEDEQTADELLNLVIVGQKQATASGYREFDDGELNPEFPKKGSLSIITTFKGEPKCIVECESVEVLPYNKIKQRHAEKEGEGDKTLEYWKKVHWKYYTQIYKELNLGTFTEDSLVVFETFKVVFVKNN